MRLGVSFISVLFTLASIASARSLVERPAHLVDFSVPPSECPGTEEHLEIQSNLDFEATLFNTPSKVTSGITIHSETPITKEIHPGVRITDRPSIIRVLEKTFSGVTFAPQASVLSSCQDVICVLRTYLGSEESAKRLITISIQTGFTISLSPAQTETYTIKSIQNGVESVQTKRGSSLWTLEELRYLSETAKVLPQIRTQLSAPVTIYRTGVKSKNSAMASSASWIKFYDGAFENGRSPWDGAENAFYSDKVFIHEFCHLIDYEGANEPQPPGIRKSYRSLLDRYQPKSGIRWGGGDHFVTDYARTSHAEDFAESCAYFILAPQVLEERAPEKYAAMRDLLFKGQDFKNSKWNLPLFPEISDLFLSDSAEKKCEQEISSRINDITLFGNGSANEVVSRTATRISSYRHSHWAHTSHILQGAKKSIYDEALKIVKDSPTFCDRGGEAALRARSESICSKTQKKLLFASKQKEETLLKYARDCAIGEKNFDSKCVDSKITAQLRNESSDPLVLLLADRYGTPPMPDSVIKEALKLISPSDWIRGCFQGGIGSVKLANNRVHYSSLGPIFSDYGSLILKEGDLKSLEPIQKACLKGIQAHLKTDGFTLPRLSESEEVSFYRSLPEFNVLIEGLENVVLIPALNKNCGTNGLSSCSTEDILKRTLAWENSFRARTSSAKTAGPASELVRITQGLR